MHGGAPRTVVQSHKPPPRSVRDAGYRAARRAAVKQAVQAHARTPRRAGRAGNPTASARSPSDGPRCAKAGNSWQPRELTGPSRSCGCWSINANDWSGTPPSRTRRRRPRRAPGTRGPRSRASSSSRPSASWVIRARGSRSGDAFGAAAWRCRAGQTACDRVHEAGRLRTPSRARLARVPKRRSGAGVTPARSRNSNWRTLVRLNSRFRSPSFGPRLEGVRNPYGRGQPDTVTPAGVTGSG